MVRFADEFLMQLKGIANLFSSYHIPIEVDGKTIDYIEAVRDKNGDYKIKVILTKEEQTMWIARDRDGLLYIYENRPKKTLSGWVVKCGWVSNLPSYALPEVLWEDKEPRELVLK